MKAHGDVIARRLEARATLLGMEYEECPYVAQKPDGTLIRQPRWRIDDKWVEFECGCRAERCAVIRYRDAWEREWAPVIFQNLPEQAVYDYVCDFHTPEMNKRFMQVYRSFDHWKRSGRRKEMMNG